MEKFVIGYSGNDPELFWDMMASPTHFTVFFLKSEAFSSMLNILDEDGFNLRLMTHPAVNP